MAAASSSADYVYPLCIHAAVDFIEKSSQSARDIKVFDRTLTDYIEQHASEREFDTTVTQFCREYGAMIDAAIKCGDLHAADVLLHGPIAYGDLFAWVPFELDQMYKMYTDKCQNRRTEGLLVMMAVPFHPEPHRSARLLKSYARLIAKKEGTSILTQIGFQFLSFTHYQHVREQNHRPWPKPQSLDRLAKMQLVFSPDSVFKTSYKAHENDMNKLCDILRKSPYSDLIVEALVQGEDTLTRPMLNSLAVSDWDRANGHIFRDLRNSRFPDIEGMVARGQLDSGYQTIMRELGGVIPVGDLAGIASGYLYNPIAADQDRSAVYRSAATNGRNIALMTKPPVNSAALNRSFNRMLIREARASNAMTPDEAVAAVASSNKRAADDDDAAAARAAPRNKAEARLRMTTRY